MKWSLPDVTASGITVDGSSTYDLFVSLDVMAAPAAFPRWREWAERAVQDYGEAELRRLRRWFGAKLWLGRCYHVLVPLLPEPRDPAQLLRALGELPLADFLRIAVTSGIVDPDAPLESSDLLALGRDKQKAREYVERYLRVSGQLRTQILRALSDPEGVRSELLAVLRRQAESPTFQKMIEETQEERERATVALHALAEQGIESLQHQLSRNLRIAEFAPVVLAPSVIQDGTTGTYFQEAAHSLIDGIAYEPLIFMVGTRRALGETQAGKRDTAPPSEKRDPIERAASAFSLLGDPSRLRLIELLARQPHYGQELATALGMSGATITHHVNVLLMAGVLKIERRAHRTYYILREGALTELARGASDLLLQMLARGEATSNGEGERAENR